MNRDVEEEFSWTSRVVIGAAWLKESSQFVRVRVSGVSIMPIGPLYYYHLIKNNIHLWLEKRRSKAEGVQQQKKIGAVPQGLRGGGRRGFKIKEALK